MKLRSSDDKKIRKRIILKIVGSRLLIFLISNLLFSTAMAQFKSTLQLGYVHDSNVFGNFAEIPDNYFTANLNLDNYTDWDYSSLDLSYNGALLSYNSYPEEDNWAHNLGAAYKIQLSRVSDNMDSSESSLMQVPTDSLETYLTFTGALARTVPHSGDFSAYQNFITSGSANLRYPFGQNIILWLNYGINYTSYDFVSSLSNLENIGRANLAFYFNKNFVLYVGSGYGGKKYYGVDTVGTAVKTLIKMRSNTNYTRGKGKGKGNSGGTGSGTSSSNVKTYILDSPSVAQATYRIGANWASSQWRAAAGVLFRANAGGDARYINYVAKFANIVSLVYDDPYSYRGDEINLEAAKDSLAFGIDAAIGLNLANKNYSRPALDTSQTTVVANRRHDNFSDFSVTVSKKFSMSGVATGFTIGLEYHHIANSSNDEFYQFTNDVVNFSVGVELF